jgi:hypothetical protein
MPEICAYPANLASHFLVTSHRGTTAMVSDYAAIGTAREGGHYFFDFFTAPALLVEDGEVAGAADAGGAKK